MKTLRDFINSPYTFWALLSLPSLPVLYPLLTLDPENTRALHRLLHPTGEFAVRFMIIALMLTPLSLLFNHQSWTRWLIKRRRYFGVAAFFYALLHTGIYLVDKGSITPVINDLSKFAILIGWLAFAIFIPLALTSNNWSVKKLGNNWKRLQRLAYVAALLTLAHWVFLEYHFAGAAAHFAPLALLELYRIRKTMQLKSSHRSSVPA